MTTLDDVLTPQVVEATAVAELGGADGWCSMPPRQQKWMLEVATRGLVAAFQAVDRATLRDDPPWIRQPKLSGTQQTVPPPVVMGGGAPVHFLDYGTNRIASNYVGPACTHCVRPAIWDGQVCIKCHLEGPQPPVLPF